MYLLTLKIFYHFFLWGTILCSCIIACIMAKISVLYSVFLLQPIHFIASQEISATFKQHIGDMQFNVVAVALKS